jgi:DNA-3-methyladenine glycosylase II
VERCRFEIEVPAPFRLDFTVWTLRRRAHNAVDRWNGACYRRTMVTRDGEAVEVVVRQEPDPERSRLAVELRGSGAESPELAEPEIRRLLDRTLGLSVDLGGFYHLTERDVRLTTLAQQFVGMRPPLFPSIFEAAVNAIACQQLSLVVGVHLLNRLAQQYGPIVDRREAVPGFPTPERLAEADPQRLRDLGFSANKAHAVTNLAGQTASGKIDLESLRDADDDSAYNTLIDLTGIGRWSAEYVLLRGLGRWHVLPGDDIGARNNLHKRFGLASSAGYKEVTDLSRTWWPYGGLVYFHLLLDALATAGHVVPTPGPTTSPPQRRPADSSAGRAR